jgi:hypothetical protein
VPNMRPSTARFSGVLNMLPDMPRFSRTLAAFPRVPPRLLLPPLIYQAAPLRASISTPRLKMTVRSTRIGMQAGGGQMISCHTRMEQTILATASGVAAPPPPGRLTRNPLPTRNLPYLHLQMTRLRHAVRMTTYLRPPSCLRLRVPRPHI